jgi:plastocyanin
MLANTLLFAGLAAAASFQVKVGSGGNVYEPSTITAQMGDTVEFHFTGSRHDVIQSSFESPCSPSSGGFFVPIQSSSTKVFTVNVTSTDPLYFYCSVASHCPGGMVGIINPA